MRKGLSYNDVCMVPKFNNVPSRAIPELSTKLTSSVGMKIPIVAANMDTIIGPELASVLLDYGSVPILHRFYKNSSERVDLINKLNGNCFVSCGVNDVLRVMEDWFKADKAPLGVCIDVAHGHSVAMRETLDFLLHEHSTMAIIAGNVCTAQATHDLINWGATAIKVGIGPGEVCTTRAVTPFGVPQFTAIQDCAKVAKDLRVPIIADGGIRSSRDITLALAAGASSVMIGGMFARTAEAARKGKYRGQASADFQEEFYGAVKHDTVPEGRVEYFEPEKSASELLDELLAGVRSGMTYGGAVTIEELQRKAEFMRINMENY